MEIVVAMAVLTALAMAAGSMLIGSLNTTSQDRQRVRAANVAAKEIELVRGQMQTNPAAIDLHLVKDEAVSGTKYHVVRSGAWQASDSFSALNLTVTVTWPDMKGVKPVVNSSVLTALGTGGDGSGGTVVTVSPAPGVNPDPLISVAPSCNLNTGTALVTVTTQTVIAGVTVATPLLSGEVLVTPTGSNVCAARTLSVVSGVVVATLPYGEWNFSATTSAGSAFATANLNSAVQLPVALNIVDSLSCSNSSPVTVHVSTDLLGTTGVLASGTVVATRAASAGCPSVTQNLDVVAGVATGTLSYGTWTFSSSSGGATATATATISSPSSVNVDLNIDDDFVPVCNNTGLVTLTVEQKNLISGLLSTLSSATVTATRTATTGCPAVTQTINWVLGQAAVSLSYGDWTFTTTTSAGTASATATIDSPLSLGVKLTVNDTSTPACAATTPVTLNIKKRVLGIDTVLGTGSVTATRTAAGTSCLAAAPVTASIGLTGVATLNLPPGTWQIKVNNATLATGSWPTPTLPGGTTTYNVVVNLL
jgi:type II secretory pathway pseudopilin PulG